MRDLEFAGHEFGVPDTHHSVVSQMVHVPPFEPLYPRSHTQSVFVREPRGLCECAGHGWQVPSAPAPSAPLYVLLGHSAHDSSAACEIPVEYVPAPQFRQSDAAVTPSLLWYVPAPHRAHVVDAATE